VRCRRNADRPALNAGRSGAGRTVGPRDDERGEVVATGASANIPGRPRRLVVPERPSAWPNDAAKKPPYPECRTHP